MLYVSFNCILYDIFYEEDNKLTSSVDVFRFE